MKNRRPVLFDIFSPERLTIPFSVQKFAKGLPVAASDCAISFSWWGKIRSCPPPWMSKCSPRYFMLIAEHSMCQPGRPGPHGLSHAGSPGLAPFHSVKSSGSRLCSPISTRAPERISSTSRPESFP